LILRVGVDLEVVVDGRGGWGTGSAGATLGAVLDTVRSAIGRRTVVQVLLDGEDLSRERQTQLGERSASEFSLLEIRTVDPQAFGRDALIGISSHLRNLEQAHADAAQLLESSEYGRGTERLSECYTGWDTLSRAVRDVAQLTGIELKNVELGSQRGDELIRKLNQVLMRFRGAMEFRDVMRLSELSDQELRPMIAQWTAMVEKLRGQIG
jgi:hypothetical protein